jgi:hypothetical protein
MGAIFKIDDMGLSLCAEAMEEFFRYKSITLREGDTYQCVTKSGDLMFRVRPEKILSERAWERCLRGLKEYGLTLGSRSRIDIIPEPKPSKWDED